MTRKGFLTASERQCEGGSVFYTTRFFITNTLIALLKYMTSAMTRTTVRDLSPLEEPMPLVLHWLLLGRRGTVLVYGKFLFPVVAVLEFFTMALGILAVSFVFIPPGQGLSIFWKAALVVIGALSVAWSVFLIRFWGRALDYQKTRGGVTRDSEKSRQQRRAEARIATKRGRKSRQKAPR